MGARNHFVSVSRAGVLTARRVGAAPVAVATAGEGLEVEAAGGERVRVFFAYVPHAPRRHVQVTEVEAAGRRVAVDEFLRERGVDEAELGRWMRAAIERVLDAWVG